MTTGETLEQVKALRLKLEARKMAKELEDATGLKAGVCVGVGATIQWSEEDRLASKAYAEKNYPEDGTYRETASAVWGQLVQSLRRELATAEAVLKLAQKCGIHSDAESHALEEFLYESCPKGYRPLFRVNP